MTDQRFQNLKSSNRMEILHDANALRISKDSKSCQVLGSQFDTFGLMLNKNEFMTTPVNAVRQGNTPQNPKNSSFSTFEKNHLNSSIGFSTFCPL